jgi:hypothetical protein
MPMVYDCPAADLKPGLTSYLLLDGTGTAFEPKNLNAAELSLSPREAATLENAGPGHAGGMRYAFYADGRVTMFDSDSVPEP